MPIQHEKDLVEKLLRGHLDPSEIGELEKDFDHIQEFDFRPLVRRIFDLNEGLAIYNTNAEKGLLGRMNRIARNRKNRQFFYKLKSGKIDKVIVAEGDSWFEYPLFIRDIVDWIINLSKYSVYSIASGGDWIGNILYSGKYITELSLYLPDAFLISGGGNDLVGDNRLALLIKKKSQVNMTLTEGEKRLMGAIQQEVETEERAESIVIGRKFFNQDFWALLNVLRFQYYIIFKSIRSSEKFDHMKIITHGYDYAFPSSNRTLFPNPLRYIFNNGRWLDTPLRIRGIHDQKVKNCIIAAMIFEFNQMMIDVGRKFKNVYHIDCRGIAEEKDWIDELHLKSRFYKDIAKRYIECLDAGDEKDTEKRIYKVYRQKPKNLLSPSPRRFFVPFRMRRP